jgi:phage-related holin
MQSHQQQILEQTAFWATVAKWIVAAFAALWVSVPFAIKLLAFLQMLSLFTALFNPLAVLRTEVKRSSLALILTLSVHFVYVVAKDQTGLNLGFDLASMVSTFYCIGTGISILLNFSAAGVEIPPVLLDVLQRADGLTGREKHEIEALKLKQGQEITALDLKQSQDHPAHE